MARSICCKNASMKTYKVLRFLLFCSILDAVYKLVQAVDGHSQGFIQTEREMRYLVDGISLEMQNHPLTSDSPSVSFTELEDESLHTFESPIIFEPPALDFGVHPLGMPQMERVVVQNPSADTNLRLLSISGSTLHFHCSFFQEKVIPPGGNTSFDVVFLARQEGHIENTLFIHTSLGSFKYQVLAIGVTNPYRIQPFLGVRMPLNSSYAPFIHMHNPHSATLQVTEMYTSGGDLHLELPSGDSESPKQLWEIPPYETRIVMRANFVARIERNHTAYIRIKTNSSLKEYLVVPIEVEVSSVPGIYSPISLIDFGVLRSHDEPKTIPISLYNSGQKHINIVNVIVAPVNDAVDVKFLPIKIPPDTLRSKEVANITFYPSKVLHQKQCSGKIVIKAKNNQFKLTIPYQVTFLQGSLGFNQNSTRFYTGQESRRNMTHVRQFNVTNHFNVTIVIHDASLPSDAQSHFAVNFTLPLYLSPGASASLGWIVFTPPETSLPLTTHLTLRTNVSFFDIPLVCFSGKLQLFIPQGRNQSYLDFGTMSVDEKRTLIFAVINENPVDINLKHWGSNLTKSYVELVGIDKGNLSTLARRRKFSDLSKGLTLKPHYYAIFRVGVTAPADEGVYFGETFIETLYEIIKLPFSLRTAKGSLITDDLFFDNAFPGKISSQPLYIRSTFSHPMTVTSVTPIPEDVRFLFEPSKVSSVLQPDTKSMVGKVFFDLRRECKNKCYSGLPTTSQMGHQWLLGMNLPTDIGETDGELYRNLRERWQNTVSSGEKNMNITFQLDTSEVHGFYLKAHATLQWPRLSSKCHLRFPITQVGNLTVKDFALENPSSLPVLVQVVPLSLYPSPQAAVSALSHKLGGESAALKHTDELDADVFTLQDLEEHNPRSDNPIPAYRKSLEEYFNVQTNKQSIAMLLTPGMRVRVRVGFAPRDDIFRTSLILIRNNLTVLDALVVQGQGGRGQIRFGNKDPGSEATLMFELTEKHLKDCENSKGSRFLQPNFTVRRAFTARNTGELPVYVRGFDVSGSPCQGYGFRILNCQGFELKPNSSRRVDIAYTPDFTLSRVERTLNLHTSLGSFVIQYVLVATLPRHLLAKCSQAIPRPSWEPLLYYSIVSLIILLLLCELAAAYFEGDRILKTSYYPIITTSLTTQDGCNNPPEKGQNFDLKAISRSDYKRGNDRKKSDSYSQVNGDGHWTGIRNKDDNQENTNGKLTHRKARNRSLSEVSLNSSLGGEKDKDENKTTKELVTTPASNNSNSSRNKKSLGEKLKNAFSFLSNLVPSISLQFSSNNAATQTNKDSNNSRETGNSNDKLNENLKSENKVLSSREKCAAFVSAHPSSVKSSKKSGGGGRHSQERHFEQRSQRSKKVNAEVLKQYDEETSSTTTESSNPESEFSEKDPNRLPDICISAQSKHNRPKSKGNETDGISNRSSRSDSYNSITSVSPKNVNKDNHTSMTHSPTNLSNNGGASIPNDEGEFELSTKSKAHKKIKVDPSKVFGGDILRPSTLELPYKPKPVVKSSKSEHKLSVNASSKVSSSSSSSSSSASSSGKKKSKGSHHHSDIRSNDLWKDTSSSLWDNPTPFRSPDETLTQISQQTENFALKLGGRTPSPKTSQPRKTSLEGGGASGGGNVSYSAVVSGENFKSFIPSSQGASGCSKVIGSDKMAAENQAIGTRPQSIGLEGSAPRQMNSRSHSMLNSGVWKAPDLSMNDNSSHMFVDMNQHYNGSIDNAGLPFLDPDIDLNLNSPSGGLGGSEPFSINGIRGNYSTVGSKTPIGGDIRDGRNDGVSELGLTDLFPNAWNEHSVSMMQMFQAEQRARIEDYKKQQAINEWSGFDVSTLQSNLWDLNYMPQTDTWHHMDGHLGGGGGGGLNQGMVEHESEPKIMQGNSGDCHMWSNPTDSLWSPATSVWPNFGNQGMDKSNDPLDLLKAVTPPTSRMNEQFRTSHNEMGPQESTNYNPYSSLSSIWANQNNLQDDPNEGGARGGTSSAWNYCLYSSQHPAAATSQLSSTNSNNSAPQQPLKKPKAPEMPKSTKD